MNHQNDLENNKWLEKWLLMALFQFKVIELNQMIHKATNEYWLSFIEISQVSR